MGESGGGHEARHVGEDGVICRVQEVEEGGTIKFILPNGSDEGFLLQFNGHLRAYLNICPHWGVPLDRADNDFFEPRAGRIICKNHGAEFDPDSCRCVAGPSIGDHLHALRVEVDAHGRVLLA